MQSPQYHSCNQKIKEHWQIQYSYLFSCEKWRENAIKLGFRKLRTEASKNQAWICTQWVFVTDFHLKWDAFDEVETWFWEQGWKKRFVIICNLMKLGALAELFIGRVQMEWRSYSIVSNLDLKFAFNSF